MRRLRIAVPLAAALLLVVPAANAAAPGTYKGWLYSVTSGKRYRDSRTTVTVTGDRLSLKASNLRLECPDRDDDGDAVRKKASVGWRGNIESNRVDGTAKEDDGASRLRLTGRFSGTRFTGRLSMRGAPGVTEACEGSARVRATLPRR